MKVLFATAAVLLLAAIAFGQEMIIPRNEVSIWGGFSRDSSTAIRAFGRTRDARFGILSVRYSRRFHNSDKVNLKYVADLTPLAVLDFRIPSSSLTDRRTAYGLDR